MARQLSGGFVCQCGTPAVFSSKNGRESPLIGEPDSVAPPPVVADLMETVLLWFSFPFHGFHEARIRAGVFTDSLFSPLIIALLDLGGISFLLSCCVLHFLGFLSLNVFW